MSEINKFTKIIENGILYIFLINIQNVYKPASDMWGAGG